MGNRFDGRNLQPGDIAFYRDGPSLGLCYIIANKSNAEWIHYELENISYEMLPTRWRFPTGFTWEVLCMRDCNAGGWYLCNPSRYWFRLIPDIFDWDLCCARAFPPTPGACLSKWCVYAPSWQAQRVSAVSCGFDATAPDAGATDLEELTGRLLAEHWRLLPLADSMAVGRWRIFGRPAVGAVEDAEE